MADHADPAERLQAEEGRLTELRAADGYPLVYRVWERPERTPTATLVLLNGVMSHSLWFHPVAGPLLDAGFKLVGADRRGSGLNPTARGDAPSGRVLLDDARAIVERERVPGRPLHLVGWCWGAVLAINLAADLVDAAISREPWEGSRTLPRRTPLGEPSSVHADSLVLLAPGLFPTAELRQRMSAQESAGRSNPPDSPCLESPITEDMFTSGPALAGFIAGDRHRLARFTPRFHDIMGKLGMGARMKLPRLELPILLVLARDDQATDNRETEAGFARLTGGRAVIQQIEGAHGMQFDAPAELARALITWIDR
jgi:alpha-beta hydrolase superfamily lysophospholipase